MLWAVFAMMTSAVVLALARSLSEPCEGLGAHDTDVTFYRGLLAEADATSPQRTSSSASARRPR